MKARSDVGSPRAACARGRDDNESVGIGGIDKGEGLKYAEHEGLAGTGITKEEDTREGWWG